MKNKPKPRPSTKADEIRNKHKHIVVLKPGKYTYYYDYILQGDMHVSKHGLARNWKSKLQALLLSYEHGLHSFEVLEYESKKAPDYHHVSFQIQVVFDRTQMDDRDPHGHVVDKLNDDLESKIAKILRIDYFELDEEEPSSYLLAERLELTKPVKSSIAQKHATTPK